MGLPDERAAMEEFAWRIGNVDFPSSNMFCFIEDAPEPGIQVIFHNLSMEQISRLLRFAREAGILVPSSP